MATSSIPGALDYLYETAVALPQFAAPVVVCDGWPDQRADTGFVIGVAPEDPATETAISYADLGAQTHWENYTIPCIIWARVGGGGHAVMKSARDKAFALFNALDSHLRTRVGLTLGDVLKSGTATLANVMIHQTGTAQEAGEGRSCGIHFDIVCKSRSAA